MEFWKENLWLRVGVVLALFAVVALAVFVWDPFTRLGGLQNIARLATIIGTAISGLALILNPMLEDWGA